MQFVFSVEVRENTRENTRERIKWYQRLDQLPVYPTNYKVIYRIHPVFSVSDENLNLLSEEFGIENIKGKYYWKSFYSNGLFENYLKLHQNQEEEDKIKEFYVYGYGNTSIVFSSLEAFIEYNLVTRSLVKHEF